MTPNEDGCEYRIKAIDANDCINNTVMRGERSPSVMMAANGPERKS